MRYQAALRSDKTCILTSFLPPKRQMGRFREKSDFFLLGRLHSLLTSPVQETGDLGPLTTYEVNGLSAVPFRKHERDSTALTL